jgi:hypothetical protein
LPAAVAAAAAAEKRMAKGEQADEMEMRTKLNSMRNDRLAAVAQQQAHERTMPVSADPCHEAAAAAALR